mgnify:CR=1 FL=1
MAGQLYTTQTQRVGKIKGEMLMHAIPKLTLDVACTHFTMDEDMGDTIIYGRWVPTGGTTGAVANNIDPSNTWSATASAHEVQDGQTPTAEGITRKDITVQIKEYSCLYMYTKKAAKLYEDKLPPAMKKMAGQRMGLVTEMIKNGAFRGSTNKMYAGGTSRATVDETISDNLVSRIIRAFSNNRADFLTEIISPSQNYDTSAVEASYLFFAHTDLQHDIEQLPGYTPVAKYGNMKPVHPMELGAKGRLRFILSPEFQTVADAGAAVGSTGLKSTSSSNVDVYPCMVFAEEAAGDIALRGTKSLEVIDLPPSQTDKNDPTGQRGYIGACFWSAAFVQNDGWLLVVEVGATSL